MNFQSLQIDRQSGIATVTLNRPDVRNAFNEIMIAELTQAFARLGAEEGIRVIVLAASGPVFCAGGDLHWMQKMAGYSQADNLADATLLAQMLRTVYLCPLPVVARVQGDCFGGGMGLAAACDIVVAAESVRFCLSEVRLGLIPATIAPYVIRAMGQQAARRYCLTAETFSAQEAQRIGFAHRVVAPEELTRTVAGLVQDLAANGPQAVRQAKALVRDFAGRAIDDALVAESAERIARIRASDEGREGIVAFLEKRKPGWQV